MFRFNLLDNVFRPQYTFLPLYLFLLCSIMIINVDQPAPCSSQFCRTEQESNTIYKPITFIATALAFPFFLFLTLVFPNCFILYPLPLLHEIHYAVFEASFAVVCFILHESERQRGTPSVHSRNSGSKLFPCRTPRSHFRHIFDSNVLRGVSVQFDSLEHANLATQGQTSFEAGP